MKTLSIFAVAAILAGLASACSVRHEETVQPATAAVVAAPAASVVYY